MNFTRTFTKLGNQRISHPNLATPISKREAQIGLQRPVMELPHPKALLNRLQFTSKKSSSECMVLRMSIYGMGWMFVRVRMRGGCAEGDIDFVERKQNVTLRQEQALGRVGAPHTKIR